MTYNQAVAYGTVFNRKVYKDGWYRVDDRGMTCSVTDLSIRCPKFTEEDKKTNDWIVLSFDGEVIT